MVRPAPSRHRDYERVFAVGLQLPRTTRETRYDGSPVLRVNGVFVAGVASHRSAEPGSIVVRCAFSDREWLLSEAPETYYVTDYHRPYPVVLARLAALGDDALRDLLAASWRLTMEKTGGGQGSARVAIRCWTSFR
jgi:hypothetical protein